MASSKKTSVNGIMISVLFLVTLVSFAAVPEAGAASQSLYEFYASKSGDDLKEETSDMGERLKDMFDPRGIANKQKLIDYKNYLSNYKKVIYFSNKLAAYSDYEKDLEFARDNEIFKGLPDGEPEDGAKSGNRKEYVGKKFTSMKRNVEDEINTYLDMINLSLDACEAGVKYDLSGFAREDDFMAKMQAVIRNDETKRFISVKERFGRKWPDLRNRIDRQIAAWAPVSESPETPIIDAKVTGVYR